MKEEKIELLGLPIWNVKQVMAYSGVKSRTTASKIKSRATKDFNGSVPYGSQYVKRDAVLSLFGTDVKTEMNKLTEN